MRTLQSELERVKLAKGKEQHEQSPKKKEAFSRREIEELMGIYKAKYKRVKGGSFRSR